MVGQENWFAWKQGCREVETYASHRVAAPAAIVVSGASALPMVRAILASFCALLVAACSPAGTAPYEPHYAKEGPAGDHGVEYLFAVHPLHNPRRLFEVYQPLVELINETAARDFRVKLETSRDYAAFEAKLASGKFQFAIPNPYQTLESEAHGYRIVAKMGNDERFRGIFIVRRDSLLRSVTDLAGAPISFPAPTALAAAMMPRMFLHQHGLASRGIDARYVGSQESAIMNVLLGKTVAAGTWPPPWEALLRRRPELARQLEVRWETPPLVNNGFVVRKDVPAAHVSLIERVVLSLHESARGRAILAAMEIDRFESADTRTFEPVRRFITDYERAFGQLP